MARFAFRLERLLALRRRRVDEARRALAAARAATRAEDERLEALRKEVVASQDDVRSGPFDPACQAFYAGLRDALAERVRRSAGRREALARTEEEARRRAEQAMRAVRALEGLRERRASEHRLEEAREERRVLDEVASRAAEGGA